jgi:hypothetical protein
MESRALKDDKVRAGTLAKKASPFIVCVSFFSKHNTQPLPFQSLL